ncbi:MAG TPA: hypothetical protein ENG86_04450, partial [Nitrospirae bacterium]|nr:hypothetical protein [Nitrospirota bacterium]
KVIVQAAKRDEAIRHMLLALDEFMIEGIKTTIPFHKKVLRDKRFLEGDFDTHFCDSMNSRDYIRPG